MCVLPSTQMKLTHNRKYFSSRQWQYFLLLSVFSVLPVMVRLTCFNFLPVALIFIYRCNRRNNCRKYNFVHKFGEYLAQLSDDWRHRLTSPEPGVGKPLNSPHRSTVRLIFTALVLSCWKNLSKDDLIVPRLRGIDSRPHLASRTAQGHKTITINFKLAMIFFYLSSFVFSTRGFYFPQSPLDSPELVALIINITIVLQYLLRFDVMKGSEFDSFTVK